MDCDDVMDNDTLSYHLIQRISVIIPSDKTIEHQRPVGGKEVEETYMKKEL